MEAIVGRALNAVFSDCGWGHILLLTALVYQTIGRAQDRAAHIADSKTWTAQAATWVATNSNVIAALAVDKELRSTQYEHIFNSLQAIAAEMRIRR